MSATGAQVVAAARAWIGTPFAHQHRARAVGVDCAGLLIGVARELGLVADDFDVTGYPAIPDGVSLRRICDELMQPVAEPECGGALLVAWRLHGRPQHLGIVGALPDGAPSLIHAENRRSRCVVEQRLALGRAMELVAAYRLPGVV